MQVSVKEDRQRWIGGSDIPIIMGISPFQTRYELMLFKAGIKEGTFEGNEYTEYGNIMESKIRDYINTAYGTEFVEGKHEDEKKGYRCHTDGENEYQILEIKTTSQIHDSIEEYKIYLVQLLFYMINTNREQGVLAVYERPKDFDEEFNKERLQIFKIKIEDYKELCERIIDEVEQFKKDVEILKEDPLLGEEDFLPEPVKEISYQLERVEHQLKMYNELKEEEKKLKEELYKSMEKYNIKKWTTISGISITKVESTPDKTEMVFNENKLKEEDPETYNKYMEETIKKGKSGYIKITLGKEYE